MDSDIAALFSFQYTTGFEILRPSFCSRLFLLFNLSGFSCAVVCVGFKKFPYGSTSPEVLLQEGKEAF